MVLDSAEIRQRLPTVRLPVMPQVLARLFDACFADTVSNEELAAIIGLDSGIAARVIAVAAAAVSDEGAGPANLGQCVALAGLNVIKAIVVNESAASVFGRPHDDRNSSLAHYWLRTLKCALLAKSLARSMHYPDPEEAYLAGLMHDIGILALAAIDTEGYPAQPDLDQDDESLCRLEQDRYRVTHAEAGAWLAERWQLNSFLSDSLRYHHAPAERVATAHPLIRIVLLATRLARIELSSYPENEAEYARLCGVPLESMATSMHWADLETDRIAAELGIRSAADGASVLIASAIPAVPDDPIARLEDRLEEKLLIDSALPLAEGAGDIDAVLKGIAQAAQVLFGLHPSLFFLREGNSEAFSGKPLLPHHAKVSQLRFLAGHTDSAVSMAVAGTPTVCFVDNYQGKPLDAQLAHLLNAEGVVCIPMGGGSECKGLIVSAINSQYHTNLLHGKIDVLRSFGRMADRMLDNAIAEKKTEAVNTDTSAGASQEQIRRMLHEVSNPLTIVRNYLGTLEMNLGQGANGKKELRILAEEITRVSEILDRFRQQPYDSCAAASPMALHDLIQGVVSLCKGSRLIPPTVNLETNFRATGPANIAEADKLKQVLLNLLKNAFEAMPDEGVLRISTSSWGEGGADNHVEIAIEDSGPGLPEDVRRSLYQPVTSTKDGQHFGIGLSIVGQLVREMQGLISCRSDPNGSCFRIILPVVTP